MTPHDDREPAAGRGLAATNDGSVNSRRLGQSKVGAWVKSASALTHRVWQDVYHAPCPNGKTAYIKVTVQVGAIVIQFKEK